MQDLAGQDWFLLSICRLRRVFLSTFVAVAWIFRWRHTILFDEQSAIQWLEIVPQKKSDQAARIPLDETLSIWVVYWYSIMCPKKNVFRVLH